MLAAKIIATFLFGTLAGYSVSLSVAPVWNVAITFAGLAATAAVWGAS